MYPGTIDGKWVGYFRYDQGYPLDIQARHISFTMELWSKNNAINGTCTDDHTVHLNICPATIIGTFEKNVIRFTKTYPHFFGMDKNREMIVFRDRPAVGAAYYGRLKKKLFSGKYYFKGKSKIEIPYRDRLGTERIHILCCVWSMKKLP